MTGSAFCARTFRATEATGPCSCREPALNLHELALSVLTAHRKDDYTQLDAARDPTAGHRSTLRGPPEDAAVQAADAVLVTVCNQIGVDSNAAFLENILNLVAPRAGRALSTNS